MKYRLLLILLFATTLGATARHSMATGSNAKGDDEKHVYMFGFAISFKDSVVYVTDIQRVAPVTWERRTHLLSRRANYSEQLRYHLNNQGLTDRTITVMYDKKKKKVEKRLRKLQRRYTQKRKYEWKVVDATAFTFTPAKEE